MKFESALELKRTLLGEKKVAASAVARASSMGVMTGERVSNRTIAPPSRASMAIGITGKKGKYKIAVRVHESSQGMEVVLADIYSRAKGEADVKLVGKVRKQPAPWHQRRNRPLRIGGSVGHFAINAGTLGCFVTKDGDEDYILSNNHVLANENIGKKGDAIIQPGDFDRGRNPQDQVGVLDSFVKLKKSGNLVDCAIASLSEGVEYFYNHLDRLGPIRGVREGLLEEGETVYKIGRTTGYEKGRVSAIELDQLEVEFDMGVLSFDNQIEIEPTGNRPFSLGGDSGSLIVDSDRRAVGLLFAGNDINATFANDINHVLRAMEASLVF